MCVCVFVGVFACLWVCVGVTPGVKVFLDDERIKIKNFEVSVCACMCDTQTPTHTARGLLHTHTRNTQEYCDMYLKSVGSMSETGEAAKSVH